MDTDSGQFQTPQGNVPTPGGAGPASGAQSPGAVVRPAQSAPTEQPSVVQPVTPPTPQAAAPMSPPDNAPSETLVDDTVADAGWQYSNEPVGNTGMSAFESLPDVSWTAAEFIEHPKSASWYGLLALVAIVVAGLDYLFTKDLISVVVILFASALFGVYAGHKPRTQQYLLSTTGLQIGEKMYNFHTFKSFSIADEGSTISILFAPLGRFTAPLTIYVSHELENKVVDYISHYLPFEQRRGDAVDSLLRRIRF